MMTVGGDAYIAPRANVGIGPYEHRINRTINWNLKCIRHYLGMVMVTTIWFSVSRCSETAAMPPVRMR